MKFTRALTAALRCAAATTIVFPVVLGAANVATAQTSVPPGSAAPPPDTTAPSADTTQPGVTLPSPDEATFAVQPSGPNGPGGRDAFIYTLKPGDSYGDTVGVSNFSDRPVTFAIYATDAVNSRDGGFALMREEQKPVDVGTWVQLGTTQYTIDAGQRADIPFSVTVPADATPGDHVGAIVAQAIPESGSEPSVSTPSLDVRLRIGARLYLRVEGTLTPALSVSKFSIRYDTPASPFSGRKAVISYTVTNSGNVRLSPSATMKVAGLLGLGERKVADRQVPELLPGSSVEISETVHGVKPYGRVTASLHLEAPSDGVSVRRSIDVWTIPWIGVVALVTIAGGVAFLLVRRHRRRRPPKPAGAT